MEEYQEYILEKNVIMPVRVIMITVAFSISIVTATVIVRIRYSKEKKKIEQRKQLFKSAFDYLKIKEADCDRIFKKYNKIVNLKSRQAVQKYDYSSFFKDNRNYFAIIKDFLKTKESMIAQFKAFLKENPFVNEREYPYLKEYISKCASSKLVYVIRVNYITRADNCLASKAISLTREQVEQIEKKPELYMTKAELKEIDKNKLEFKKKYTYNKVNEIIDKANSLKDVLIIRNESKVLDELVTKLFDRTVNSIQKIKAVDSEEWKLIGNVVGDIEVNIDKIVEKNQKLQAYYSSDDFNELKNTCNLLMQSQKDFNSYIDEKIETITKMFGTRVARNETETEDVYNYVRTYKKTVSPFTAELSSTVFASAENNPVQYLLKCFYPNRSLYKEQIINLKNLLNELEALKDAKQIIENYKKDYAQYIVNVPRYVLEDDEDGFYSRLGFAVIDENVLNVEYKFVYTSNGGMAQRSFTIPMTEETIAELINELQGKLSSASLAKEQRALMTPKLRLAIKERDNYTCCMCGNSTHSEPNLLLEIDHKIPIAKGGLTIEDNLQTLCWKCNRNKGAKII